MTCHAYLVYLIGQPILPHWMLRVGRESATETISISNYCLHLHGVRACEMQEGAQTESIMSPESRHSREHMLECVFFGILFAGQLCKLQMSSRRQTTQTTIFFFRFH